MREILIEYKKEIISYAKKKIENIENIEEIRINISAVFKCTYKSKPCILKYLVVGSENIEDKNYSEYLMIHAEKIINLSTCSSFPEIYEKVFLKIENFNFLLIIEEYLPYKFSEGILKYYKSNNESIVKSTTLFLHNLLNLYIEGMNFGFVSHRDLSFDNLMFSENYNLKMIDLGSAKSIQAETTHFHIVAPTKNFYSAPEYEAIHRENKTEDELIKAEIYTIGLLTLSLLNSLHKGLFVDDKPEQCGIVYWLKENGKKQILSEKLGEFHKREFINYVLINIFDGDEKNKLYKLLKGMTDRSVSARVPSYEFIIKILERGM